MKRSGWTISLILAAALYILVSIRFFQTPIKTKTDYYQFAAATMVLWTAIRQYISARRK